MNATTKQFEVTPQFLRELPTKEEVLNHIRKILEFDASVRSSFRGDGFEKQHYRFEMSGYEGLVPGSCTVHNLSILNKFAFLGIYDYTKFLTIDFYKGTGTLYFQNWNEDEMQEIELSGGGTCEIIYEIFRHTIFTDKPTRRRN